MGRIDAESETFIPQIGGVFDVAHLLRATGFDAGEDGTGRGTPLVPISFRIAGDGRAYDEGSIAAPLTTATDRNASTIVTPIAFGVDDAGHCIRSGASKADKPDSTTYVAEFSAVRRLTPRECERLQGFPDDFTRIPYRGKVADLCPDGPRYKAIGNSWAVNCAEWIGERIAIVDKWGRE